MSIFCSKNLKLPPRLGDLLRMGRENQGWDIRSIYVRTHIPPKYVSALEAGEFKNLPKAKAHRIAYVKEYAATLGLDPEKCLQEFFKEEGLKDVARGTSVRPKRMPFGSLSILIRNLVLGTLVTGFTAFLIFQINNILKPPVLIITNPTDGFITSQRTLTLEGTSDSSTNVTLNGQEITLDKNNHFSVKLDLIEGLNSFEVEAQKKHGKMSKKTLSIIVKQNSIITDNIIY
jgi:cytoskeletal protein RodZ